MKTLLVASGLILAGNTAVATSFEEQMQNPDLGTGVYDKPATLTEPRGIANIAISLDEFNRGNPAHSSHSAEGPIVPSGSEGFTSTLDRFNEGNPDHS